MKVSLDDETVALMAETNRRPIDALLVEINLYYLDKTWFEDESVQGLTVYFPTLLLDTDEITDRILSFLWKDYGIANAKVSFEVRHIDRRETPKEFCDILDMLEENGEYTPPREAPLPKRIKRRRTMELNADMERAREAVRKLVGAGDFKALCDEILTVSSEIEKNNTAFCLQKRAYLFAINDGYGYTSVLNCMQELFRSLSFMKMAKYGDVSEMKLQRVTAYLPDPFAAIYEKLDEGEPYSFRILSIDISEWISELSGHEFKTFLQRVAKADGYVIVFRVPFVDKEVLSSVYEALNDVMFVRAVGFPPFTKKELRQIAEKTLSEFGFTLSRGAWELFDEKLCEEKSDGRFYGVRTVHKVVRELVYQKQLANAKRGNSAKLIGKEDVKRILTKPTSEKTAEELLNGLVGAEHIKKRIDEIVSQIVTAKKQAIKAPCIHMRFIGNPGTGKTTVARIVGKLLKEKGVLQVGSFYEYAGRDLVGRYIGETAPRTAGICRDAYGSVLFIDEAYSLYRGPDDQRDFGREALDTLVAEMENHRSDFLVIMAGYTDDMAVMLKGNAGLASRMPYTVEFPNFTREELYLIFKSMAKHDFACDEELLCAAREYFDSLPESMITAKEFANGRFVRNLYERVWAKAALRCQLEGSEDVVLKRIDFELSTQDGEFNLMNQKKKRPIGFMP